MSGPDIFISYSREERSAARHFAESFAREGFSVWWDAALRSGQTFDEVIEDNLRAAKAVIVLWSPRSVASRWVRAEATLADRGNKLVPVIIEPCNLPIIFELTQAADLSNWTGDTSDPRWQTLVCDIRGLAGPAAQEYAPPEQSAADHAKDDDPVVSLHAGEPAADLSKPTAQEDDVTQFFHKSDVYRLQEGDRFHCLQRIDSKSIDSRFVVSPVGVTIGRSAPADIIISGSAVSRSHCLVELSGDKLRVTDLNSTNGTFIDDVRIERSAMLPVGSILRVGNVAFEHETSERSEMAHQVDLMKFVSEISPRGSRLAKS